MKVSNRQPTPPPEPVSWEYKICSITELAEYGKKGWQAYAATENNYGAITIYLKRPIK